ncbi:hypothetical protein HMPREF0591_2653, partial [Mycobacterium parascrofulaceum ATCC BAA-614]
AAAACVAAAARLAPPGLVDSMQRLVDAVDRGRSPGDDFSDRVIEHGIAATVAEAARCPQGGL